MQMSKPLFNSIVYSHMKQFWGKKRKVKMTRRELREMAAAESVELAAKLGFDRPLGKRNSSRFSAVSVRRTVAAAASVALLIGSGVYFATTRNEYRSHSGMTAQAGITVAYTTGDVMQTVKTEDGSEIFLNTASSIHYDRKTFNRRDRRVEMTAGEAFFKIAPDREKPFFVNMGEYRLKVLGTSFNINRYRQSDKCVVSVVTGKVKILNSRNEEITTLTRNQEMILNPATGEFTILEKDCSETAGWTAGKLILNDADGQELKFRIEQRFNVHVDASGEWTNRQIRFRAAFAPETSLEEVLIGLKAVYGINYRLEGNRVTLSGGIIIH
jgi:ferric-dicitrate binding protein FerR (iron transport regulator)